MIISSGNETISPPSRAFRRLIKHSEDPLANKDVLRTVKIAAELAKAKLKK